MKTNRFLATALVSGLAVLFAAGCSPTGWMTKSIEDGSSLRPGEQITVLRTDGDPVQGEFTGTEMISPDEYNRLYLAGTMKPIDGKYLPMIGQTIQITTAISDSRAWIGQLIGFDGEYLLMKESGEQAAQKVYFSSLTSVSDYEGRPIRRMELRSMFERGEIPLMKAIAVREQDRTVLVPISSVREVRVGSSMVASGSETTLSGKAIRDLLLR